MWRETSWTIDNHEALSGCLENPIQTLMEVGLSVE